MIRSCSKIKHFLQNVIKHFPPGEHYYSMVSSASYYWLSVLLSLRIHGHYIHLLPLSLHRNRNQTDLLSAFSLSRYGQNGDNGSHTIMKLSGLINICHCWLTTNSTNYQSPDREEAWAGPTLLEEISTVMTVISPHHVIIITLHIQTWDESHSMMKPVTHPHSPWWEILSLYHSQSSLSQQAFNHFWHKI